jgi:AcrR family transcriptional regulator
MDMKRTKKKNFRQIRYEDKKSQILESAARIFSRKGFEKATMEDVSNELYMTKGSLYHYIKSKEDMLFQCHMKALEMGNEGLEEILNSDYPPKTKLYKAIIRHIELITKEFVVGSLRQQELLLPKHMYEKVIKERDKFEKIFMKILEDAIKELHLNKDDVKIRAYTILGAINWIPRWYSSKGKLSATEIGKMMADYLVGRLEGKS